MYSSTSSFAVRVSINWPLSKAFLAASVVLGKKEELGLMKEPETSFVPCLVLKFCLRLDLLNDHQYNQALNTRF